MIAYGITYRIRGNETQHNATIEAKNLASAKKKIGKKHGYKTGNMIQIERTVIIGYI